MWDQKASALPVIIQLFTAAYENQVFDRSFPSFSILSHERKEMSKSAAGWQVNTGEGNRRQKESLRIDFRELTGTNCYCDDQAAEKIREKIKELPTQAIHFLDSGNYHYMTYYWLEKIEEPFCLIVFDHHTDMQAPALGDIMSCGGWVREAVLHLPMVRKIIILGPKKDDFEKDLSVMEEEGKKGIGEGKYDLADLITFFDEKAISDFLAKIGEEIPKGLPVYFSIDKDILSDQDAVTNWSQGELGLDELVFALKTILGYMSREGNRLLGVDICGEDDTAAGIINEKANAKIAEVFEKA